MRSSERRRPTACSSPGGFTVAELTVAILIAVNVLIILWQVFIADQRRFSRDQGKLSAMQSALLFAERLEGELREVALTTPDPTVPDKPFTIDQPILFGDYNRRISFLRFAPADPKTPLVPVERITYARHPSQEYRMVRAVGDQASLIKNLLVDSVLFEPTWVELKVGNLGFAQLPPVFRPDLPIYLLKYRITASPETPGSKGPADVPPENKFTLVNSVPVVYRAERWNHPYWVFGGSDQLIGK